MSDASVRTRFAPSPTGGLHLGNIRTALFNALFARGHGGRLILRSEDTDRERSDDAELAALMAGLDWLGLVPDEGPGIGGAHGPYCQSERMPTYHDALERLDAAGYTYPCYCTRDELAEARQRQLAAGRPPRYPGTCRDLDADARAAREADGRSPTIRFRVPARERIVFDDLVLGRQSTRTADIGDFVIARSDGTPAFFLANALDDAAMAISHVLRGDDHLTNTPRQLLLLRALGLEAPLYGHFGLILDHDGRPLSKRRGGAMLDELRNAGTRPEAVTNHLARIGFTPASDGVLSLATLAGEFDLERIARGGARHDETMLAGWQDKSLEALDNQALWDWLSLAAPSNAPTLPVPGEVFTAAVRANVRYPEDAWHWAQCLFSPSAVPETDAGDLIEAADPAVFEAALAVDTPAIEDDFRGWARAVGVHAGVRGRELFRPLRAVLTNAVEGPELAAVVPLIPCALRGQRLQTGACRAAGVGRSSDNAAN